MCCHGSHGLGWVLSLDHRKMLVDFIYLFNFRLKKKRYNSHVDQKINVIEGFSVLPKESCSEMRVGMEMIVGIFAVELCQCGG